MNSDEKNPLRMVIDPYAGDFFVLPDTPCTQERRLWFRRAKEILGFLSTSEMALIECRNKYQDAFSKPPIKYDTPIRIESIDGRILVTTSANVITLIGNGIDVLCRQVFVMLYGSLETYIYDLMARSFPKIGVSNNILDCSREIMMKHKWDGKFCKISDTFDLNYRASDLMNYFKDFEMAFEGKTFKHPLAFLDELAQVRHRIVHASSIIDKGRYIFVNPEAVGSYFAFSALLTDFIDGLFGKKFGYVRDRINPAVA